MLEYARGIILYTFPDHGEVICRGVRNFYLKTIAPDPKVSFIPEIREVRLGEPGAYRIS